MPSHLSAPVPLPSAIDVAAGQRLHLWVPSGATLVCIRQSVTLVQAPRWIGDQMMLGSDRLSDGQAWTAPRSGWLCIAANRDSQLLCLLPVSQNWLGTVLNGWRRLTRRLYPRDASRGWFGT